MLLERLRWPNGAVVSAFAKNDGKQKANSQSLSARLAARSGAQRSVSLRRMSPAIHRDRRTVFESSHVPIGKWLMAMFIICSSKKSISAKQLHRDAQGCNTRRRGFMAQPIRFAMGTDAPEPKVKRHRRSGRKLSSAAREKAKPDSRRQTPVVLL